jgi:lipopolysaccharide export LptBFGC system permease protein LptF
MTAWDKRSFLRALSATLLGVAVVWLITAASDEGKLSMSVRAGRTLPLTPIAGAVGVALVLGTARVRSETRALEALGRHPSESIVAAVAGAALPSVVVAVLLFVGAAHVAAFYPRAVHHDAFVFHDGAFESASLGVRVEQSGEMQLLVREAAETTTPSHNASLESMQPLPRNAKEAAAVATSLTGIALPLASARAVAYASFFSQRARKRRRNLMLVVAAAMSLLTLVAFQATAAGLAPAMLAALPAALLLLTLGFTFALKRSCSCGRSRLADRNECELRA